ncbi:MAG: O-antigen ligase family protein [Bacteroidota bacterium]
MGAAIGLITLLVVTLIALQYGFLGKTFSVKGPFGEGEEMMVSSRQRFILFLLAVGIVQAGMFSAVLLLVWIVFLLIYLSFYKTSFSASGLFFVYIAYLIWLLYSLALSPEPEFGFRVFAKYLFPFLVVAVVSSTPITTEFFHKALKVAFASAVIANLVLVVPYIIPIGSITAPILNPIIWWGPAIIDFNPFALACAFILYKITGKKIYLYAAILFILPPVLASVRTGLVGLGVALLAMSFFKYKIRALPLFLIIIGAFIISVLYIPQIRNKMFRESFNSADEVLNAIGTMSSHDIDSSGRFAMWEWNLKEFYEGRELMGSGLGNLQAFMYSGDHHFGGLQVVHNDYVQILADTGQIGLVLYLLIIIAFIIHSFKIYNNKRYHVTARHAAFIAGTSFCGIMACAFTDNVINYSLITLSYSYAFFGFALALRNNTSENQL